MNYLNKIIALSMCVAIAAPVLAQTTDTVSLNDVNKERLKWSSDGTREQLMKKSLQFFGKAEGGYVNLPAAPGTSVSSEDKLVANQFNFVLGGIPGHELMLPDGNRLVSASQAHSADTKAIYVLNGSSNVIKAAALLHWNCSTATAENGAAKDAEPKHVCDKAPTLTIFFANAEEKSPQIRKELLGWMRLKLKHRNKAFRASPKSMIKKLKVETRVLEA
jgi:hypothetical protein